TGHAMRAWLVRSEQRTELSSPPQTAVEPEPPQMMEFRISPDGFRGASSCGSPADGSALVAPAPAPPRPPWLVMGGLLRKRASQTGRRYNLHRAVSGVRCRRRSRACKGSGLARINQNNHLGRRHERSSPIPREAVAVRLAALADQSSLSVQS
ncbi:MAG: hypothetical protein ACPIOQ_58705, partial [Promethearchaeia archaeon]